MQFDVYVVESSQSTKKNYSQFRESYSQHYSHNTYFFWRIFTASWIKCAAIKMCLMSNKVCVEFYVLRLMTALLLLCRDLLKLTVEILRWSWWTKVRNVKNHDNNYIFSSVVLCLYCQSKLIQRKYVIKSEFNFCSAKLSIKINNFAEFTPIWIYHYLLQLLW